MHFAHHDPLSGPSDSHSPGSSGGLPSGGWDKTDWTLIDTIVSPDASRADQALELTVKRYWPAIYAYIRAAGRDAHEAADLTQGFVCDVMLGRHLLVNAERGRGRFRALLVHSIRNYLYERHRHESRKKRKPQSGKPVELDRNVIDSMKSETTDPQTAFSRQWSATLIRRVLDELRRQCESNGMDSHWAVFEARVVRPMLLGDPPVPYDELVERLNLADAAQASNMMITIKRRFARALYEEVSRTVSDPQEVEHELRDLLREMERPIS